MKDYSILAKYYDRFSQNDCDYVGWSQYLSAVAKAHNVRQIADIACGTGKMSQLLVQQGYSVVGVDQSREMLQEASAKCRATFVCQDMRKLALTKKCDMAVVVNDGINYLKPSELAAFFENLSHNMKEGAPLVFDVSSPYKLQHVLANNVFFVDEQDATLLWTNKAYADKTVLSLSLFQRNNETYSRFDEQHTQYVHTPCAVEAALIQAGFTPVQTSAEYGKQLTENSLRITFYALNGGSKQ